MREDEAVPLKLARPRLERIHPRVDLLYLLDQLRTAPLTIISGLSGAGKSALIASYAQTRNIPSLWYQVDRHDEKLNNFFRYLDIATHKFISLKRVDLPIPGEGCTAGDSAAITSYFAALFRCMYLPFLVVMDNYHQLSEGAPLHGVIRDACAALPIGGRIILIADNDTPPTLTGLRANQSAVIIGWQELQLHPDKIKEVAALQDLSLSMEDIAQQVQRRVGPWAARLMMSLQAPPRG